MSGLLAKLRLTKTAGCTWSKYAWMKRHLLQSKWSVLRSPAESHLFQPVYQHAATFSSYFDETCYQDTKIKSFKKKNNTFNENKSFDTRKESHRKFKKHGFNDETFRKEKSFDTRNDRVKEYRKPLKKDTRYNNETFRKFKNTEFEDETFREEKSFDTRNNRMREYGKPIRKETSLKELHGKKFYKDPELSFDGEDDGHNNRSFPSTEDGHLQLDIQDDEHSLRLDAEEYSGSKSSDVYIRRSKPTKSDRTVKPSKSNRSEFKREGIENKRNDSANKWSDTFGTMSPDEDLGSVTVNTAEKNLSYKSLEKEDKNDELGFLNHIRLSRYDDRKDHRHTHRHPPVWYARQIMKFEKQGKVKEAIEVFDKWMIQNDRVMPNGYEMSILIRLLGRCGYTLKAFKLYKQMHKMGVFVRPQTYTSLFNACINSPWPEQDGLKHARQLRQAMLFSRYKPNYIIYQAMIQAFGRCGDLNTAFSLADEVAQLKVDDNLLNCLLMACISDKTSGFRHAILVWRKMLDMGVRPSLNSFNLLLRTVKECGIGQAATFVEAITGETATFSPSLTEETRTFAPTQSNGSHDFQVSDKSGGVKITNINRISGSLKSMKKERQLMDTKLQSNSNTNDNLELRKDCQLQNNVYATSEFVEIDSFLDRYDHSLTDDFGVSDHSGEIGLVEADFDEEKCNDDELEAAIDLDAVQGSSGVSKEMSEMSTAIEENKPWWEFDVFFDGDSTSEVELKEVLPSLPDILDPRDNSPMPNLNYKRVDGPIERFALLGGINGFLKSLSSHGLKPDLITFSQMVAAIPLKDAGAKDMIIALCMSESKADTDFYNHLIREVVRQNQKPMALSMATEIVKTMKSQGLVPNIRTYGVLAHCCKERQDGMRLLDEMEAANLMPTALVFSNLFFTANRHFAYKRDLLLKMQEMGVKPSEHFILIAEQFLMRVKAESHTLNSRVMKDFMFYIKVYERWCKHNAVEVPDHPWKTFREEKKDTQEQA
ncbi:pentatricopeptide repeat-containing protein 1, mitochondrial-like [Mya arenaria]|uniref:pentatricopeptide repeat-containing protein 1, mitochondrial-like n=1 Tax=Mya arenaria TaxID=6604 RepID=UPI0022E3DFBF|nr:pentatricopeptide repeat-containing protein 1, mitochondrial-like [Mya arenaria]